MTFHGVLFPFRNEIFPFATQFFSRRVVFVQLGLLTVWLRLVVPEDIQCCDTTEYKPKHSVTGYGEFVCCCGSAYEKNPAGIPCRQASCVLLTTSHYSRGWFWKPCAMLWILKSFIQLIEWSLFFCWLFSLVLSVRLLLWNSVDPLIHS